MRRWRQPQVQLLPMAGSLDTLIEERCAFHQLVPNVLLESICCDTTRTAANPSSVTGLTCSCLPSVNFGFLKRSWYYYLQPLTHLPEFFCLLVKTLVWVLQLQDAWKVGASSLEMTGGWLKWQGRWEKSRSIFSWLPCWAKNCEVVCVIVCLFSFFQCWMKHLRLWNKD